MKKMAYYLGTVDGSFVLNELHLIAQRLEETDGGFETLLNQFLPLFLPHPQLQEDLGGE